MKKLIILSLAALAFASCTKKNNDINGDGGDGGSTGKYTYSVDYVGGTNGTDNFLFYELSVSYRDSDGQLVEESVTEYPYRRHITGAEPPFTAEITPTYTLRKLEDISTDKESLTVCDLSLIINYKSSDGQISNESTNQSQITMPLENAYKYISSQIEKYNGKTIKVELE